ncbi:MAG TPA: PSD1 and planctomycete cytochrome C domain-containing protein [Lacipirellulaceae bacterium]|nr:PSD1 and planctomycete cytochrome C domain-containing protein [Lacipirellulaceae bacterium]
MLAATPSIPTPTAVSDEDALFFERSVRPLLAEHCWECHAGDSPEAGLRLDSWGAMVGGGDSGPAVMPGKTGESLLITAIHYDGKPQMPPDGKLRPEEIDILTKWIERGAPWPKSQAPSRTAKRGFEITPEDRAFWSFRPISDPPPPDVTNTSWPQTPIDAFVLARLEEAGLAPSLPADKRTLIRRTTFDLTGLPPTPEEIAAFLADDSPDAFARVVDRLLASPHYGERWARHWLDVARYGEDQAHTFEARLYTQGFRYRDWVVSALNEDMPYDQFLRAQIAADLDGGCEASNENLPALGFFAIGPVYYGDRRKLDQFDDRIDTLTRGLLGLTVACARCHDHKFDPISTADYYALAGVVASTDYVVVPLVSEEEAEKAVKEEDRRLKEKDEKKKKNAPPPYPHVYAIREAEPHNMQIHIRGNPETLGAEVPRRFLSILSPEPNEPKPFTEGSGRKELAEAIACRDNPLTARVIVNRVWKHHFGQGLVRTPSNFGHSGEPPTHRELLDHLASRFIASGWSLKSLHRAIMLSAVYQQSSGFDQARAEVDPDNRLLWRINRRRLEVEAWRDAILAVSGTLDTTLGGSSLDLASPDNNRRTLYAKISRHNLDPLLRLFDFPDPNITSDGRPVTTVPLQQLFVLNSPLMATSAKALAVQCCKAKADDRSRIQSAFERVYGRPPTDEDLRLGLEFLAGSDDAGDEQSKLTRWEQYAQALLSTNEFMFVD